MRAFSTSANRGSLLPTVARLLLTLCLLSLAMLCQAAGRGDWWMFGHDPQHTGRSPYTGPATPTARWVVSFSFVSWIFSSLAISADGTLYVGSYSSLYAINPDGTKKWAFPASAPFSSPAIGTDGTIYVGSDDGNLYAVNPDGTPKWARPFATGNSIESSPVIGTDGVIYVGSDDGNLYAVNPDGSQKWVCDIRFSGEASPAIATDGTIYLTSARNNELHAINPDGTVRWASNIGGSGNSSPSIGADGTIYVGASDHNLYAFTPTGTQKWRYATKGSIDSTPAIGADGTIYFQSYDNNLYAVTPAGMLKWTHQFATRASSSPPTIGADGTIYFGAADGNLYAVTANGTAKWAHPFVTGGWTASSPVLGSDGTLYIGSADSNLYAIGTNNPGLAPALTFTKSVTPSKIAPGGTVMYTIAYANHGGTANNLVLTDLLPAGISYYPHSASGFITNATASSLSWIFNPIYPGNTGQVTFLATVNANTPLGTNIVNTAASYCNEVPAITQTNTASFQVSSDYYTIKASAGNGGGIAPGGLLAIASGTTLTFTATRPTGYLVESWYLDGAPVQSGGATYTLKNITAHHTVSVQFYVPGSGRGDWWMFHHDAQHTGRSPFTGPSTPVAKWMLPFTTDGRIISSPAISTSGTLYAGSDTVSLYAVNPDGSQKWIFYTGGIVSSPAIGTDGTIYIGDYDGNLWAVNPDGSQKWSQPFATGDFIESSPVIGTTGTIYVGSNDGNLYAINPDGTQRWASAIGFSGYSSPALASDGTLYIGSAQDDKLYAINPNGTTKWSSDLKMDGDPSPAIGADGTVYIGSWDNNLYAFSANGSRKWTFATGDNIESTPAIGVDGTIYIGSGDGNLYAITPSGTAKWTSPFATAGSISCSPVIGADGTIYIGTDDGNLYAVTANGTAKWAHPFVTGGKIASSPILGADGSLYFGSSDSNLYAIGAGNPAPLPALTLTKSVSPSVVKPGGTVTYTLTCSNTGNGEASNTVLYDRLPAGVTVVPSSGSLFHYDSTTRTLTWNIGTLDAGAVAQQVTFHCTVNNSAVDGSSIVNVASIYCNEVATPVVSNAAAFAIPATHFTVTSSADSNGMITPGAPQRIPVDGGITFTARPNVGFLVMNWTLDGKTVYNQGISTKGVYTGLTCAVNHVRANHTLNVFFLPKAYQPDLLLRTANESAYTGGDIFNLDGTHQTKSQWVPDGSTTVYYFRILNTAGTTDTFTITAPAGGSGWTIAYFDLTTGAVITLAITGTGWSSGPLAPGAKKGFFAQVTPGANVPSGALNTLKVTAVSVKDATKKDVVKAVTTGGGDVAIKVK